MNVAVICEYSGRVRDAFIARGHSAISFDLVPSETPGPHHVGDVMKLPREFWAQFDIAICHPPCTHLAVSGAKHFARKLAENPRIQEDALDFVRWCMDLPIEKVVVENPVGIISSRIRKPDQIVQPWHFGDSFQKTTCLWLKGVGPLVADNVVDPGAFITTPSGKKLPKWYSDDKSAKSRSRTFPGFARAMAEQWG